MRAPLRRWASTARPAAYRRRHAAAASDLRKRLYALVRGRGRGEKVTADVAEVAQRLPEVVQSAQLYHVADICRMMAQLNAPRRGWLDAALDRSLALLRARSGDEAEPEPEPEPEPRGLATMAHALGGLKLSFCPRDQALLNALGQQLAKSAGSRGEAARGWDDRTVAGAVAGLAKLHVRHEAALLALGRRALSIESRLGARPTASILHSLATLNCAAGATHTAVADRLGIRFAVQAEHELRAAKLLGDRCHRPRKRRKGRHERSQGDWATPRMAVSVAWSLTVLDRLSPAPLRAAMDVLTAAEGRAEGSVADVRLLCQLHQVLLAVELGHVMPCPDRSRRPVQQPDRCPEASEEAREAVASLPCGLAQRSRRVFRKVSRRVPQAQLRKQQRCPPSVDSTGSVAEALALACPGERVHKEGVLDNCAYSVDLVLPDRRLAVEVDGKVHFARRGPWELDLENPSGGAQVLGRTALKRRQIRAMGWRLVAVPYWEWDDLLAEGGGAAVRFLAGQARGSAANNA